MLCLFIHQSFFRFSFFLSFFLSFCYSDCMESWNQIHWFTGFSRSQVQICFFLFSLSFFLKLRLHGVIKWWMILSLFFVCLFDSLFPIHLLHSISLFVSQKSRENGKSGFFNSGSSSVSAKTGSMLVDAVGKVCGWLEMINRDKGQRKGESWTTCGPPEDYLRIIPRLSMLKASRAHSWPW